MNIIGELPVPEPLRAAIEDAGEAGEDACVEALLAEADLGIAACRRIRATATRLVERIRTISAASGGLDAFMHEYDLGSREGVMLMCLAEALLRVPDAATADRLIIDKIGAADWERHLGHSESLFVNASTWALMLTGKMIRMDDAETREPRSLLRRLIARSGEPVIRQAMFQAMRIIGRQFVMGRTIGEALERARPAEARGYRHSYDMLGESARTAADAERYFQAYVNAIGAVGKESASRGPFAGPGISIKLSALHPRFEFSHRGRVHGELLPVVRALAERAKAADIGLCVDTEEADRLDITLDVVGALVADPAFAGWEGFGLAIQAYQKRGRPVIAWLADLARRHRRKLSVRLVKGAYWDAEIKRAQELGLAGYPVFTRKANTDVSYIACAKAMLAADGAFYGQFATHNAHTLASVIELAGGRRDLEFQRLHGMGEALHDAAAGPEGYGIPCRIYAPVGSHEDLLSYLVRRLLENGSNTSFVNRIVDASLPIAEIVADPVAKVAAMPRKSHPRIPLPPDLYGAERRNSRGLDLADPKELRALQAAISVVKGPWAAAPVPGGRVAGEPRPVLNPANLPQTVGMVTEADDAAIRAAVDAVHAAAPAWRTIPAGDRAACLDRAADRFEVALPELMALLIREAGKTINDALGEIREAVDFCRYYASEARRLMAAPQAMPGPTGENNHLALCGRGIFAAISPWNFPLAIFVGQVSAALAAGNAVIAKPAEQTPLIAALAVRMLYEAGVPEAALALLPGDGAVGARLLADPRIDGVVFTGSVETAHAINRLLAARPGPIVPLIAETGGLNAMIVDSTAVPEQAVGDVMTSAFRSAGQRCSALRVLFVQKDIAAKVKAMLAGALAELTVGDPASLASDVGPVIDAAARSMLEAHAKRMEREGTQVGIAPLTSACAEGHFFAPRAYAIDRFERMGGEVFGPILHVIEFAGDRLDTVVDTINGSGYGLTLGIHTRLDSLARRIGERARVGNVYVNRNMIGAVVGVQPFGGEGLSGTGPKAGGPHYLLRFVTERTLTVNTSAAGGNAALLSLDDSAAS